MRSVILVLFAMVFFLCLAAYGGELPIPVPLTPISGESGSEAITGGENAVITGAMWVQYLDIIVKAVLSALGLGLIWLVKLIFKEYKDKKVYIEAVAALEEGWSVSQEQMVVWAKRAAADGKLSKDERAEARDIAIQHAKAVASGPAQRLLVMWGKDKIASLLGRITAKNKKKA